ncbi:uncharacterized protein BJ212DRAFT_1286859, partial [Suillus subaureus]
FDIVTLQEPFINTLGNTKATPDWNIIYPMHRFTHNKRSCTVTLIHKQLDTNNWRQILFPSLDVVVIQMQGTFGKLTIVNIYDNSKKREVLPALTAFLDKES